MALSWTDMTANQEPDDIARRTRNSGLGRDRLTGTLLVDVNNFPSSVPGDKVKEKDMIWQQLQNIVGTFLGQEHFEPGFGSNIWLRVFETASVRSTTSDTLYKMELDLFTSLERNISDKLIISHADSRITISDDGEAFEILVAAFSRDRQISDTYQFLITKP